ncbi:hypothetical protein D3C73_1454090 [compost metagenome]
MADSEVLVVFSPDAVVCSVLEVVALEQAARRSSIRLRQVMSTFLDVNFIMRESPFSVM